MTAGAKQMDDATASVTSPEPTDEQCSALLVALGLSDTQASVGIGAGTLHVHVWKRRKRPLLSEWAGWPVEYHIGGGSPRASKR